MPFVRNGWLHLAKMEILPAEREMTIDNSAIVLPLHLNIE